MSLQQRVAIVTGAAQGIGRAIAQCLAAAGARVVVTDVDSAGGQAVVEEIVSAGNTGCFMRLDVVDPDNARAVAQETIARYGALHILVNNAAITACYDDFLTMTVDSWRRVIDVNLTGTFICGQAAAKEMSVRGGGRIINIASVGSFIPEPHVPHYIAAKGGVLMLTRAMALDLAPYAIAVNAIAPGPIRTEKLEARYQAGDFAAPLAHVPMRRPGTPVEVANAALFLASDEASFITGETLVVDGGYLIGAAGAQ